MKASVAGLFGTIALLLLAGCSAAAPAPTVTVAQTVTVTATPTPSPTSKPAPTPTASALVQQIRSQFPGYPLVVDVSTIDYRVANAYPTVPQVVALAPGLYTAYNPAVTDLDEYIDKAGVDGDCILKDALFPTRGGSCWDGITAGSAEPR